MTICDKCGLPKELCACETIAKESQKITIKTLNKKFGKVYTMITGINDKEINMKDLTKQLKTKFACGGTTKEGYIELQGDHKVKVKAFLVQFGFAPDTIEVR